jgi:hypothetical protein
MTQFEKTFNLMKNPRSIAIYISLVILSFLFVDRPLATYFHQLDFRTNLHVLNLLTILGKDIIYLALFFFCGFVF